MKKLNFFKINKGPQGKNTTNHKDIGILYLLFGVLSGICKYMMIKNIKFY